MEQKLSLEIIKLLVGKRILVQDIYCSSDFLEIVIREVSPSGSKVLVHFPHSVGPYKNRWLEVSKIVDHWGYIEALPQQIGD
jgi:hypothetical protein